MTAVYGVRGEDGRRLAWPLLRKAAGRQWGWTALPEVVRSSRGKPYFQGNIGRWFSLAHSGGYALCALSDAGPVGVDVEIVQPHRPGLPQYALSQEELAQFDGSWGDFTRLWTLKESWCKREDSPLYPPRLVTGYASCPHKCYGGESWQGAVCCWDDPPETILWFPLEALQRGD